MPVVKQATTDRRLDWGWWQAAYLRYSMAAVATGQMTMTQCMEHLAVVTEVAASSLANDRSPWVAVLYDEVARCAFVVSHGALYDALL